MPAKKGSVPDLKPQAAGRDAGRRPTRSAIRSPRARPTAPRSRKLGALDPRVVALDADVGNSTFSDRFEKQFPDRFYQAFIAEQGMVGAAMGLASRGAIAFPSTFACFLSRAYDFVRMANISMLNVKMAGSHAGVSIGEDGPSQMALEDLAMMRAVGGCAVLYPSRRGQHRAAARAHGLSPRAGLHAHVAAEDAGDLRRRRRRSAIGGSHSAALERRPTRVTLVGAGITLFEALRRTTC